MTDFTDNTASPSSNASHYQHMDDEIHVGKDVLELLTGAMYIDPLCIFREYVQNACDAIDEAAHHRLYTHNDSPQIKLQFDTATRSVTIRDNGIGVNNQRFARILTS